MQEIAELVKHNWKDMTRQQREISNQSAKNWSAQDDVKEWPN